MSRIRKARKKRRERDFKRFLIGDEQRRSLENGHQGAKRPDKYPKKDNTDRSRCVEQSGESHNGEPKKLETKNGKEKPVLDVTVKEEGPEDLEKLVRSRMEEILSKAGVAQVTVKIVEGGVEKTIKLKRGLSEVDTSKEDTDDNVPRGKVVNPSQAPQTPQTPQT